MDIKEVLRLPVETEVKCGNTTFTVIKGYGTKFLRKNEGSFDMKATLEVVEADYELVRKKLTFFEAMALVSEGKVVESCAGFTYKKDSNGALVYKEDKEIEFNVENMIVDEILGDWYEVTE